MLHGNHITSHTHLYISLLWDVYSCISYLHFICLLLCSPHLPYTILIPLILPGECIDIWAPGENIHGLGNEDYEEITLSGTSVAAAFVSGTLSTFMEEINSHDFPQTEFSVRAKEKMLARSERDVLGNIGALSPNRILQTASSPCTSDDHCEDPKVCVGLSLGLNGACGVVSDFFN